MPSETESISSRIGCSQKRLRKMPFWRLRCLLSLRCGRNPRRKCTLDPLPARGEIAVSGRQAPDRVRVIGKNAYRKQGKRSAPRVGCAHPTSAYHPSARLTWRARGLHDLPQRWLRSARAARIGRWSTRGQPRSGAIGRTEHRSGIAAALHWHRTLATGALIFLFLTS